MTKEKIEDKAAPVLERVRAKVGPIAGKIGEAVVKKVLPITVAVVLSAGGAVAFSNCDNDNDTPPKGKDPVLCGCPDGTEHYEDEVTNGKCCEGEDCVCPIIPRPKCADVCEKGTEHLFGEECCVMEDCACVVYYGALPNGVKIYAGEGVTPAQIGNGIIQNVLDGYDKLNSTNMLLVDAKVTKILIISGANGENYYWDGNGVLGFKFNRSAGNVTTRFEMVAGGSMQITVVQLKQYTHSTLYTQR